MNFWGWGFYTIAITIYLLGVRIATLFNKKAALMVRGQRQTFKILKEKMDPNSSYLWFHAASLGEFEQGRPLIERIKKSYPQYKILLTFFSPSGYEVRKNYEGADVICYLPLDTPINAVRFVRAAHPVMAFFIKYEFWQNYFKVLEYKKIPIYSVSSIFRPEQVFFRWYGGQYYKVLTRVTHFFVQNEDSQRLLGNLGVKGNVMVVGDTRFDRVKEIALQAKELSIVEAFKQGGPVFVAGSSWEPDEELFIPYFNGVKGWKMIIAPHVVTESHLEKITKMLTGKVVRYTQATPEEAASADCLLIDCYGLLSSVYRYGTIGYVGGGFGVGIHNLLEAAIYGIPVLFGPNNKRFQEAQELLACQGGFEITDSQSLKKYLDRMLGDKAFLEQSGRSAGMYVHSRTGASDKIIQKIFSEI